MQKLHQKMAYETEDELLPGKERTSVLLADGGQESNMYREFLIIHIKQMGKECEQKLTEVEVRMANKSSHLVITCGSLCGRG